MPETEGRAPLRLEGEWRVESPAGPLRLAGLGAVARLELGAGVSPSDLAASLPGSTAARRRWLRGLGSSLRRSGLTLELATSRAVLGRIGHAARPGLLPRLLGFRELDLRPLAALREWRRASG